MTSLGSIDLKLYHLVLFAPHPSWLSRLMIFVTRPENFFLGIGVAAFFLILWGGRKGRFLVVTAAVGVSISDPLTSRVIKSIFHRVRPCHGVDPSRLPLGCSDSYSFPSSHAVNIFCEATIVSLVYPKATPFAYMLAVLVAYSRVYLGVHYPFDVIGGALIGLCLGWGVFRLIRGLPFTKGTVSPGGRP
jgi:undecaprenyl-diphosphatase